MRPLINQSYEFGPFRLDASERVLLRNGEVLPITAKAFHALLVLVENSGHIVERDELMQKVWPDTVLEEGSRSVTVSMLRKAVGDSASEPRYLATIPGRGYRFVADVRETQAESADWILEKQTKTRVIVVQEEELDEPKIGEAIDPLSKLDVVASSSPSPVASPATALTTGTIDEPRRSAWKIIVGAGALVAIGGFGLWLYKFLTRPVVPFQTIRIAKLTNTGKASDAVLSFDGKYIAYVLNDNSIWVRQVATSSNIQIVSPTGDWYGGLSFSPDGNYIYYGRSDGKSPSGFYRVPALGGLSTKLTEVVSSPISFSPDGRRFAFVRRYQSQGETALIIANADGTGEQRIATRKAPDFFGVNPSKPAWSPDGKSIACPVGSDTKPGYRMNVVEVRLEDGTEKPISSHNWRWIRALAWLSDGSGLVMTALEYQERLTGSTRNFQVWYLSYPGGEPRKITSDSNEYGGISVTADSNAIVTTQTDDFENIWVAPNSDTANAKQITPGVSKYNGVSWMPDGRIACASITTGDMDIWTMDADGNNQRQLTSNARANGGPSVSPDGRYIVFYSTRAGTHIWRMDSDGGNPKQLTDGAGESFPHCSPDGKWVVYYSTPSSKATLWKVQIEGGEPVQLTDEYSMFPAISPDGKLVAYFYQDERANPKRGLAVIPFEGGHPVNRFAFPLTAGPFTRWTPDGRGVAYVDTRGGVSNIWSQPIDGSPPKQLTDFKSEQIFGFDWSRDGKQLAFVRAVVSNDIIL